MWSDSVPTRTRLHIFLKRSFSHLSFLQEKGPSSALPPSSNSEHVITHPASQNRQKSKYQAFKANYPSLQHNTNLTVLPARLLESIMFSNCKYFPKNKWTIKLLGYHPHFQSAKPVLKSQNNLSNTSVGGMNSQELPLFFPTLGSLEHCSHMVIFLVKEAEDFRLCS